MSSSWVSPYGEVNIGAERSKGGTKGGLLKPLELFSEVVEVMDSDRKEEVSFCGCMRCMELLSE